MTNETLNVIKNAMAEMQIEYSFLKYRKTPIVYPYFVGTYTETEAVNEDGMQETTFMLNGFTRGEWSDLEAAKESIADYFGRVGAKTVIYESGNAAAIYYGSALVVPTGDADFKSIQINMNIKEWKVN